MLRDMPPEVHPLLVWHGMALTWQWAQWHGGRLMAWGTIKIELTCYASLALHRSAPPFPFPSLLLQLEPGLASLSPDAIRIPVPVTTYLTVPFCTLAHDGRAHSFAPVRRALGGIVQGSHCDRSYLRNNRFAIDPLP